MKNNNCFVFMATLIAILSSGNIVLAQSVGIGSTLFTPHSSSMLEIESANKGILIPRVALTGINDVVTILLPATSLLVYNNGKAGLSPAGYYYFDGTRWQNLLIGTANFINNSSTLQNLANFNIDGNGYLAGKIGVGTVLPLVNIDVQAIDNPAFVRVKAINSGDAGIIVEKASDLEENFYGLFSNSVEFWKIRTIGNNDFKITNINNFNSDVLTINTDEKVSIGTTPSINKLHVQQSGTLGSGYGASTVNAIFGYGGGANYSFGVTGYVGSSIARTGGVHGANNGGAWGALGYYANSLINYGGYFTSSPGTGAGKSVKTSLSGIGSASIGDLMGSWSRGELFGSTNIGGIYASYNLGNEYTSGVSADIVTVNNQRMAAYTVTSNDIKVYSDGKARLTNGICKVTFTNSYKQLISQKEVPIITISALGECEGLYIVSANYDGFTVKELHKGQSNVEFNWIAIAKRVDADIVGVLPEMIKESNFDENIKGVMFNDNNKVKSSTHIFWDGNKLRFDKSLFDNNNSGGVQENK